MKLSIFAIVLGLAASSPVWAQRTEAKLFDPAVSPSAILATQSSQPLGHLQVFAAISTSYANDLLVARTAGGDYSPIRHRMMSEVAVGLGLFERFDLALSLPIYWSQIEQRNLLAESGAQRGVGDLRIEGKFALIRNRCQSSFGAAIALQVTAPTGDSDRLMGDRSAMVTPQLIGDFCAANGARVAVNLGYRVRDERTISDLTIDDELRLSVGGEVPIGQGGLFALGELGLAFGLGAGAKNPDRLVSRKIPLEARGALRYRHGTNWILTAGVGGGLTQAYGAPDFRVFANVGYLFGKGVADRDVDHRLVDSSKDGVDSGKGKVARKNAPPRKGRPMLASAGRTLPLNAAAFDQALKKDDDVDGDGIPTSRDRCPKRAEDPDGFEDQDGCPDDDNDGDGIPDAQDRCPLKAETVNGLDDDDGCPDQGQGKVALKGGKLVIAKKIHFASGSDVLINTSYGLLNQVAALLRSHWNVRKVRVEGHTDDRGDKEMNVDLSERRARRVMEYLIKRGVARHRLLAKGYGPKKPIADNVKAAGRAKNRRVAFTVVVTVKAGGGK